MSSLPGQTREKSALFWAQDRLDRSRLKFRPDNRMILYFHALLSPY